MALIGGTLIAGCGRPGLTELHDGSAYPPSDNEQEVSHDEATRKKREDQLLDRLLGPQNSNLPAQSPQRNAPPATEKAPEPTLNEPTRDQSDFTQVPDHEDPAPPQPQAPKRQEPYPGKQPRKPVPAPLQSQPKKRPSAPASAPKPHPSETSEIHGFWDARVAAGRQWTKFTVQALKTHGRELYQGTPPADIGNFCPRYLQLDENGRLDFWVKLVSAIAAAESSFNPRDSYRESMTDSAGSTVVSRGLLQISMESSQPYGCGMNVSGDLHDPQRNLECGVKILKYWIPDDTVVSGVRRERWLGGARYWSTLRDYNHSFKTIRALLRQSSYCHN